MSARAFEVSAWGTWCSECGEGKSFSTYPDADAWAKRHNFDRHRTEKEVPWHEIEDPKPSEQEPCQ